MKRAFEIAAALAFAALMLDLAARMTPRLIAPAEVALLALAGCLGLLATDAVSGCVHWLCDTFGDERTPLVGPFMIAAFREHHRHPLAITRRSALEVNTHNALGMIPILGTAAWLEAPASFFGQALLFSFGCAVYWTNTFHRWAHQPRVPRVARLLQKLRLAIAPERHAAHHEHGGRGTYCVTTGWLNPALDRLAIFPRIEGFVRRRHTEESTSVRGSATSPEL